MTQYTVKVDGMQCGMCEAHVNDAVRKALPVKKVTSSHGKGETVILSEEPLDPAEIRRVIVATRYTAVSVEETPYRKRGLFGFGK